MESLFTTYDAKLLDSSKNTEKDERRYRNILAASGKLLESGEVRDIQNLYVMNTDGRLIKVADLNTDPEKQSETYTVQAQADHGEIIDGELVPSIEKQFGSCRVWLEDDGLHARMYFADNDTLADHAWAISEDASYSTGVDWFMDGYYGADNAIEGPVGILREISMVLTGNDPRAKTIDSNLTSEAVAKGSEEQADSTSGGVADNQITNERKETMSKDMLTSDEFKAAADELINVLAKFTETNDGAESTEKAADDVEAPAETEAPVETTDSVKTTPVVVIRDRAVKQEVAAKTTDWLTSKEGHKAFADLLGKHGRANGAFDSAWRAELAAHNVSTDGISGLPTPAPVAQLFVDALEKSTGIISHFEYINTKSLRINLLDAEGENGRAKGHKKGEEKSNQVVTNTVRDILNKMVYKRLDLDALEVYENPELIDFRAKELVEAIVAEIERAAVAGDGRSEGTPDNRMFDGTRGFYSIKADAAANNGFASTYEAAAGSNLYDAVVGGRAQLENPKNQPEILVASKATVAAMRLAKDASGAYLIAQGAKLEDILGVAAIYTPSWMDGDENAAYLFIDKAYKMIGQNGINVRPDFDTSTNQDILLDETPRGGSLGAAKSAVALKIAE